MFCAWCYDDRHVRSRVSGLLFFIRCAQQCNFNCVMLKITLPENLIKFHNTLMLIENVSYEYALKNHGKENVR